jgi:hypothetical protein
MRINTFLQNGPERAARARGGRWQPVATPGPESRARFVTRKLFVPIRDSETSRRAVPQLVQPPILYRAKPSVSSLIIANRTDSWDRRGVMPVVELLIRSPAFS